MRFLEWLVLLPLWRRVIGNPSWHVPAAVGTGIAWVVIIIIIIIAVATAGGDDEEGGEVVNKQPTVTATAEAEPTGETTDVPEATPEPPPEPAATPEPTPGPPTDPATTFGDGTFVVGQDVAPGTYRNSSSEGGCFWERLSGFTGEFDDSITNSITAIFQIVTILDTDAGFSSLHCGTWSQDLSPITADPAAPFGDGIYQIGTEIQPGTWRNEASAGCFWARLSGFSREIDDTIATEFSDTRQIVTIAASDVGFHSEDCGTWTKVQ